MDSPAPITVWLGRLKAGDPAAAEPLWRNYFARLVALARDRLRGTPRATADEEDVALSAFDSFCRGAEQGRFPRLDDRDDLWQLLVMLTVRKAVDLARHQNRLKRAGTVHAGEMPDESPDRGPTPEFAAQVAEECRRLLGLLGDDGLRQLALWKMEGYTNAEIGAKIGRSVGTVERKLALIRKCWEGEAPG
jgi:DNA-directed RNA polymerase specialized sigma24 family protein